MGHSRDGGPRCLKTSKLGVQYRADGKVEDKAMQSRFDNATLLARCDTRLEGTMVPLMKAPMDVSFLDFD